MSLNSKAKQNKLTPMMMMMRAAAAAAATTEKKTSDQTNHSDMFVKLSALNK